MRGPGSRSGLSALHDQQSIHTLDVAHLYLPGASLHAEHPIAHALQRGASGTLHAATRNAAATISAARMTFGSLSRVQRSQSCPWRFSAAEVERVRASCGIVSGGSDTFPQGQFVALMPIP
jgi:hypothetical protein